MWEIFSLKQAFSLEAYDSGSWCPLNTLMVLMSCLNVESSSYRTWALPAFAMVQWNRVCSICLGCSWLISIHGFFLLSVSHVAIGYMGFKHMAILIKGSFMFSCAFGYLSGAWGLLNLLVKTTYNPLSFSQPSILDWSSQYAGIYSAKQSGKPRLMFVT